MSTRRTEDPTHTLYMNDDYARTIDHRLYNIEGTLIAQYTADEMLAMSGLLMIEFENWWASELPRYTDWSLRRGIDFAARELNRLSPDYQAGAGLVPSDYSLRNDAMGEQKKYIGKLCNELETRIKDTISRGIKEGLSIDVIREQIEVDFKFGKNRANQIARTEMMNIFNTSARLRYQSWGVKKYRFHAHLDCCKEPKELKDGSVVQRGCEELHNQVFPVTDDVHCPCVHPLCRCTILPVV